MLVVLQLRKQFLSPDNMKSGRYPTTFMNFTTQEIGVSQTRSNYFLFKISNLKNKKSILGAYWIHRALRWDATAARGRRSVNNPENRQGLFTRGKICKAGVFVSTVLKEPLFCSLHSKSCLREINIGATREQPVFADTHATEAKPRSRKATGIEL